MEWMPDGHLIYRRGEIRWVNLDPIVGAQAKKIRTCVIVQNNVGNRHSLLTVVMPLLPGAKNAPCVVNVKATPANGLERDRYIDVGQIRAIDSSRILELVGVLEDQYWKSLQAALNVVLGF